MIAANVSIFFLLGLGDSRRYRFHWSLCILFKTFCSYIDFVYVDIKIKKSKFQLRNHTIFVFPQKVHIIVTMLKIITNYTPRSHVLCGEALKDVYADFRLRVLRTVEWATWHSRMKIDGSKGWCIRKDNLQDLTKELECAGIRYEIEEFGHLNEKRAAKIPEERNAAREKRVDQSDIDLPEHMCCSITLHLMKNPVQSPNKHSYESKVLRAHLKKSKTSPMTRKPLDVRMLIPNIELKAEIKKWADEHNVQL